MTAKEKIFDLINQAQIAEAFEQINNYNINSAEYNQLKKVFIWNKNDADFVEQLKVFVGTLTFVEQPENFVENFVQIHKPISELNKADILGKHRAKYYKMSYLERDFDKLLRNKLQDERSCILLGNPLAGKSTAIYEALKQIQTDKYVLIPQTIDYGTEISNIDLLHLENTIVVLNDIERYYEKENANTLIQWASENCFCILATCRSGDEYKFFEENAPAEIKEIFGKPIEIAKDITIQKQIPEEFIENYDSEGFDGNIGSLFLPLAKMRERYKDFEKGKHLLNGVCLAILKALKFCRYTAAHSRERMNYAENLIKFVGKRILESENDKTHLLFEAQFRNAVQRLSEGKDTLNFLERNANMLLVEDVYLEKIVQENYKKEDCLEDADRYFEIWEKKTWRIMSRNVEKNQEIDQAETFEQALAIFDQMEIQGITHDTISYSTLLNKSPNFEKAYEIFTEMKSKNLVPNEISYSTLLNKSPNFEKAYEIFTEMKSKNLLADAISYNTLLNKSPNFETQKLYYKEFLEKFPLKKGNFKSEKNYNFLFTALFKKVKTKKEWEFVQSEIFRLGLKLNDYAQSFYENLSKKYQ